MNPRLRRVRWAGFALALILAGIQFVPVDRTNPPVRTRVPAPGDVQSILRRACYDCHSNETKWPWYSYVAPASWFVVGHVKHGRGDLNFSEWPTFDIEAEVHAFKDIERQISKGDMPLRSYTFLHSDATLNQHDRNALLRWARSHGGVD